MAAAIDETRATMLKAILLGSSGGGKTSILKAFDPKSNKQGFLATIGVDYTTRNFEIGTEKYKIQLWDTAGQERFRSLTDSYYRGADIAALVINFDSEDLGAEITQGQEWMRELQRRLENGAVRFNAEVVILATKPEMHTRAEDYMKYLQEQQTAGRLNVQGVHFLADVERETVNSLFKTMILNKYPPAPLPAPVSAASSVKATPPKPERRSSAFAFLGLGSGTGPVAAEKPRERSVSAATKPKAKATATVTAAPTTSASTFYVKYDGANDALRSRYLTGDKSTRPEGPAANP